MRTTLFSETAWNGFHLLRSYAHWALHIVILNLQSPVILNLQSPVILNLFQDNEQPWRVILKQVQDDEGGAFRMTRLWQNASAETPHRQSKINPD